MRPTKPSRSTRYSDLASMSFAALNRRLERYRLFERLVAERLHAMSTELTDNDITETSEKLAAFSSLLMLQNSLKGRINVAGKVLNRTVLSEEILPGPSLKRRAVA